MECNGFDAYTVFNSNLTSFGSQLNSVTLADCPGSLEGLYINILTNYNIINQTFLITGAGNNATLTLTNTNGDILVYGKQALSNTEFTVENSISISPNPVKDILNISIANNLINTKYSIFSLDGKLVINNSKLNSKLDVSYLKSGIYFLNIEGKEIIKFVKN